MKKYTKEELFKMDAVDVYKLVLQDKHLKRFPIGFWERPEALDNATKCIKYLIEDMLKLSDTEIKEEVCKNLFVDNKLRGMLKACFKYSPTKAILETYPEKNFKVWEFKCVPKDYWNKETGALATRWLVDTKLGLSDEELKKQLSSKLFIDNGLNGMLQTCFDGKPTIAIIESFPEKNFKVWDFNVVPQGYWTIKRGIETTRWLINTKLQLSDIELKEQLNQKLFMDNGLMSMLEICFSGSPIQAILESFPEKNFKTWEFKSKVPQSYWTKETGIECVKWLIEIKLQLNDEQLKEQLNKNLFIDNGLQGMLQSCFDNSPIKAILETYPNKDFKVWEFKTQASKDYWNECTGVEATKWLIETKLKLTDEQLKEKLSIQLFRDNGLYGMLFCCFGSSPFKAINTAYPNKFKREDFKNYK